ncbi:hypothetical protein GWO43_12070 [candidate division KSB1 bacterium]|nr:hypothetical protein [candidate division KSB1 bacterium]NIR70954.1 hypothetical protein [candidate division KSB1 bacterium]NIS24690.1 hypothetical protein [candidate division KSB1 bacterium]NIT71599.1 hypothetical protein [candidate division KSB1 bacterium]NIU25303.1 hypothetical protein [candidate division KSB1 bacterium]
MEITVQDNPNHTITTLLSSRLDPGEYRIIWDLRDLSEGICRVFITISKDDEVISQTHGDVRVQD